MTDFECPFCHKPGTVDCSGERVVTLATCGGCSSELMVDFGGVAVGASDYVVSVRCDDCGSRTSLEGWTRQSVRRRPSRVRACGGCPLVLVYDEVAGTLEGYTGRPPP
jgi:hypothetical protein